MAIPPALIVLVFVVLLALLYTVIYRSIIRKDILCETTWEVVEDLLQKRNDVIPPTLEILAQNEALDQEVLSEVIEAREAVLHASTTREKLHASYRLTNVFHMLVSDASIDSKWKTKLTDIERATADAIEVYRHHVIAYNTAITSFPGNVVAGSKFRRRDTI